MNDELLYELHILGSIKPGDKLALNNSLLSVHSNLGTFSAMWRYITGESRTSAKIYIRRIYSDALLQRTLLLQRPCDEMCVLQLKRLDEAIISSLGGVKSLITTYRDDAGMCVVLKVMANKIQNELKTNSIVFDSFTNNEELSASPVQK